MATRAGPEFPRRVAGTAGPAAELPDPGRDLVADLIGQAVELLLNPCALRVVTVVVY
jgi:hypothetical protein